MTKQSAAASLPGDLVSAEWLQANLDNPRLVVLDCSWHQPHMKRDALAEYAQQHISGARFFDFDQRIADPNSSLPHMLPDAELFAREVGALGIGNDSLIVVYDAVGIQTAARGWWMFRCFGHEQVAVLDGGLPAWREAGGAIEQGETQAATAARFEARFDPAWVRDLSAVKHALGRPEVVVVDARSAGRFAGTEPEPRAGMRGGHMPSSVSLPFTELLDKGRFKSVQQIESLLEARELNPGQELVFSCGSGVTACILALGAKLAGYSKLAVYDGSWSEWGGRDDTPIIDGS
ncbi:MAG: sulfurtransferase [Gammaproteobacteria bacterium]|nr:sulfurtransferase [Gammaproteobacteria bacterium]